MNRVNIGEDQVLIAGGGPVGLTAALSLLQQGIPVTIIDSYSDVPTDPRASTFHPPTMEILKPIGVTDDMQKHGIEVTKWQYRDREKGVIAEFDLSVLSDLTDYPFRLHFEQHKYAQLLLRRVQSFDQANVIKSATVERAHQSKTNVSFEYKQAGNKKTVIGRYAIGADGGRSTVRHSLGVEFQGLTFPERFLVLTTSFNFRPHGFSGTCYIADPKEWCSMFNVPGDGPPGRWRVVFPESSNRSQEELFADDLCQDRLQRFFPHPEKKLYDILHKNIYQVHQRIASTFRVEKIFLAGDAAHVNNPLGGMGLNFGIHDALNIADKIGQVWMGQTDPSVFDLYDRQRRTVAEEYLLAQTAHNKRDQEEKEPVERAKRQKEWQDIANDPKRAKAFLMRTAMFESTERARSIE